MTTDPNVDTGQHDLMAFEALLDRVFARFISVAPADMDDMLLTALGEIATFVGADRSYIVRCDDDERRSWMTHEWCRPGVAPSFDDEQGLSYDAAPNQHARLAAFEVNDIPDVHALPESWSRDREYLQREGITAILEVPYSLDGGLDGVVGFDCVTGTVPWRPGDVTALRAMASLLGQMRSRAATEAALSRTLNELHTIFEEAPVALLLVDSEGLVRQANERSADVFGLEPASMIGREIASFIHPEDLPAQGRLWGEILSESGPDRTTTEFRLVTERGTRWHRAGSSATRSDTGVLTYVTIHLVDIDDARRAAAELDLTQRRFSTLVDNLPDAVLRLNTDFKVVFANPAAEELRRWIVAHDGPLGKSGWPHPHPAQEHQYNNSMWTALRQGVPTRVEHILGLPPHEVWYETNFVPEFDTDGEVESLLLVGRDITERRLHDEVLAHRASHDTLTGLPNRARFLALLDQATARLGAQRLNARVSALAVLFFDLDRFKVVNDSLGHAAGDQLLVRIADRLRDAIRPGDVLARLGGDEFTVMVDGADVTGALRLAERLQDSLRAPIEVDGREFIMSASIGVVATSVPENSADLLRWADAAMYRAKEHGRNRIAMFDETLRAEVTEQLELDQMLRTALDRDELRVRFQPEVDLGDGRIIGAEALVRWEHPTRGLIAAGEFVPLAEENGMIVPIGRWVLETSCMQVMDWIADGRLDDDFVLRVNLSPRQLELPTLVTEVRDLLRRTGFPAERLCLEITETALMRDVDNSLSVLTELHQLGLRLAVDDFGTGYSSLSSLKRFPLHVLKIDRSFVDGLPDDAEDMAIVRTILLLAESLGLSTTAEGVETQVQREALVALGCPTAQGYLFSRPISIEQFADLIDTGTVLPQGTLVGPVGRATDRRIGVAAAATLRSQLVQ